MRKALEKSLFGARQLFSAVKKTTAGIELPRHIARVAFQGLIADSGNNEIHDSTKKTLVMVPGWGCGVGTMKPLGDTLSPDINVLYPDGLPSGLLAAFSQMSLEEQAARLADFADRVRRDHQDEGDIYFAGHSNGGVASLLALRLLAERSSVAMRERIKGVVTMASPINASPDYHYGNAPLISRLPATRHLRPNSKMHHDLKLHHESLSLCIASSRDELLALDMQSVKDRPMVDLGLSHWDYTFGPPEKIKEVADHIIEAINLESE